MLFTSVVIGQSNYFHDAQSKTANIMLTSLSTKHGAFRKIARERAAFDEITETYVILKLIKCRIWKTDLF